MAWKYHVMTALPNIGVEKNRCAVLINYQADVYLWLERDLVKRICFSFYSARNARIASAVLATAIPSLCPSVRPSVRHTPVLCQNDGT